MVVPGMQPQRGAYWCKMLKKLDWTETRERLEKEGGGRTGGLKRPGRLSLRMGTDPGLIAEIPEKRWNGLFLCIAGADRGNRFNSETGRGLSLNLPHSQPRSPEAWQVGDFWPHIG
jgi:hypothetical protein